MRLTGARSGVVLAVGASAGCTGKGIPRASLGRESCVRLHRPRPNQRKPSKNSGKPSKGNRKRGKGIRKGIKGKPFRELGLFNGLRRSGAKTRFLPPAPFRLLVWRWDHSTHVSDNRKKKSGSYGVICWSTGLLFVRRTLAVMAGLVPAIHAGPPQNKSRLGATGRKADGRKAFRACLRRCAGPSWMAGTSPAMTP